MSAFVVNNHHINAMLQATAPAYHGDRSTYYWQGSRHPIAGNQQEVGQKLVKENTRSVNHRYHTDTEAYRFEWLPFLPPFSAVQIIKACNCYDYQSCETPEWKETEAYAIMTTLRERAIRSLPGYEEAAWEVCYA